MQTVLQPVVRRAGEGEKRWFFGGGVWTWKVGNAESGGDLSVVEVEMEGGKCTPLHTHPTSESMWILEGRIRYRIDTDVDLGAGDFILVPAGIPHAFLVLSETARVLSIQPSCLCEPFYRGSSEPLEGSSRATDFGRLQANALEHGGIEILGPPPF